MKDYQKLDAFGVAPQMERSRHTSSSNSSQESSFIEERRARVMREHSSNSLVSSRDSSVLSTASSRLQHLQQEELQQLLHEQPGLHPVGGGGFTLFPLNEDAVSLEFGEVSLAESESLIGQFGSPADCEIANWTPRQDTGDELAHTERERPTIEFPSMLPPTTIPGLAPSPLLAPTYASAARHSPSTFPPMAPLRARAPRIQLLDQREMMAREQMMYPPAGFMAQRWPHPEVAAAWHAAWFQQQALFSGYGAAREQNETPARRARSAQFAAPSRRNSTSSEGSSSSRHSLDCSYCRSVMKNPIGHNKHNCPILADLPPCRICGAGGKYNHTESHCPDTPKTVLRFIPKHCRDRSFTI